MKKLFFAALLAAVALPSTAYAQTAGEIRQGEEHIQSFHADIAIEQDASLHITETIIYDFGGQARHGIYRIIPYKYSARGGTFALRMSDFSVTSGEGRTYPFEVSTDGSYKQIKIGDPDITVTGVQTYRIAYTVKRAINYFGSYDELYWNVTGNEWQVPITEASASILLPHKIVGKDLRAECFEGPLGIDLPCREIASATPDYPTDQIRFKSAQLAAGAGLTIVAGFPKGTVAHPGIVASVADTVRDNIILLLPAVVLAFLLDRWRRHGRDPKGRGVVVAQYEAPDSLAPGEIGTILDERADNRDFSADIVNLAVRGYLRIVRTEKKKFIGSETDYALELIRKPDDLTGYEKTLVDRLFVDNVELESETARNPAAIKRVTLSRLKNRFYSDLRTIRKEIYNQVTSKGYFEKNPEKVRNAYVITGIAIAAGTLLLYALMHLPVGFLAVGSAVVSGVLIILFGFLMPKRTKKGAETKELIQGLKRYLSVAEKDRIYFHNAPQKSPERFEKLLPYAMALGVENEWAKQFEGIYTTPPGWYSDASGSAFNAVIFAHSLNSFSTTANNALASTPRNSAAGGGSGFGGGGFSGGGFGGGGGGSW